MDKESPTKPSSACSLALWLITVATILRVFVPPTYEAGAQKSTAPVNEKAAASQEMLPPSLQEEPPAITPLDILLFGRGKQGERLFHPIILEAANRNQVDPAMIKAIIMAESGYDPKAISKKGAKGLMQLMPITAEELGVEDSFNPEHNINAGVRYYKELLTEFEGDVKLALAAYNAGIQKVRRYQGIPPYKATQHYIKKVFEYYRYYKKQMVRDSA